MPSGILYGLCKAVRQSGIFGRHKRGEGEHLLVWRTLKDALAAG